MRRRLLRWLGVSHEGMIRVKANHWWEWRRANRLERYLNWMPFMSPPPGFYGHGIGELLETKDLIDNGTN